MPRSARPPVLLTLALLLATACASSGPKAGTGDVAFRVAWDGVSDLDLLVLDPAGECIFFGHREADSGGLLDVDCNAGPDTLCDEPIENVYWPTSTAPKGDYHVWVRAQMVVPDEAPLELQMEILEGAGPRARSRWTSTFTVEEQQQLVGPYRYDQSTGRVDGPIAGVEVPKSCQWGIHLFVPEA